MLLVTTPVRYTRKKNLREVLVPKLDLEPVHSWKNKSTVGDGNILDMFLPINIEAPLQLRHHNISQRRCFLQTFFIMTKIIIEAAMNNQLTLLSKSENNSFAFKKGATIKEIVPFSTSIHGYRKSNYKWRRLSIVGKKMLTDDQIVQTFRVYLAMLEENHEIIVSEAA